MFDENGQFKLQLGTSKKIFSTDILAKRDIPVYLTKPPYDNSHPLLDCYTIIAFLSIFDKSYSFSQTQKQKPKLVDGQMFTHFMDIKYLNTLLFKIKYQSTGNYFLIQIINNFDKIKYVNIDVKLYENSRNVYFLTNLPVFDEDSESPMQFRKNPGISELSDFYNHI